VAHETGSVRVATAIALPLGHSESDRARSPGSTRAVAPARMLWRSNPTGGRAFCTPSPPPPPPHCVPVCRAECEQADGGVGTAYPRHRGRGRRASPAGGPATPTRSDHARTSLQGVRHPRDLPRPAHRPDGLAGGRGLRALPARAGQRRGRDNAHDAHRGRRARHARERAQAHRRAHRRAHPRGRQRHRPGPGRHADDLLCHQPPGMRGRGHGHRQPQPAQLERLQDRRPGRAAHRRGDRARRRPQARRHGRPKDHRPTHRARGGARPVGAVRRARAVVPAAWRAPIAAAAGGGGRVQRDGGDDAAARVRAWGRSRGRGGADRAEHGQPVRAVRPPAQPAREGEHAHDPGGGGRAQGRRGLLLRRRRRPLHGR